MFGNQNNQQQDDNQIPDSSIDGAVNADAPAQPDQAAITPVDQLWQHPGAPLDTDAADTPATPAPAATASLSVPGLPAADAATGVDANELLDIKHQALTQLSPLVGHLDQTPEEKFRTTMMMIQASDDQSLVKDAYAAAQAIKDEKARAQALLDIINEINYFTQHHPQA